MGAGTSAEELSDTYVFIMETNIPLFAGKRNRQNKFFLRCRIALLDAANNIL